MARSTILLGMIGADHPNVLPEWYAMCYLISRDYFQSRKTGINFPCLIQGRQECGIITGTFAQRRFKTSASISGVGTMWKRIRNMGASYPFHTSGCPLECNIGILNIC